MKQQVIIHEAAESIEANLRLNNTHSLTSKDIADLLPGCTANEVNSVIRYLLGKRVMKHSCGRFVLNYHRQEEQRSMIHQYLADIERAASFCLNLPPVNWLDVFAGDLDQNERTIFKNLAEPIIKMWTASYYEREKLGHFRNLNKGSLFSCN